MYYSTEEPKDMGEWCDVCNDLLKYCFHGNYGSDTCICELCIEPIELLTERDCNEYEEDILKKINNKPRNNT